MDASTLLVSLRGNCFRLVGFEISFAPVLRFLPPRNHGGIEFLFVHAIQLLLVNLESTINSKEYPLIIELKYDDFGMESSESISESTINIIRACLRDY
jgi:hypothetical protein